MSLQWACALAALAGGLALLWSRVRRRRVHALAARLKGRRPALPLLGHTYLFFGNNENIMKGLQTLGRDAINDENGLCPLWVGTKFYTVVAEGAAATVVLKAALQKDDITRMATFYLDNGSIFAPVSIWKPRRRKLMPTFSTKNMKHFFSIFVKQSNVLTERLAEAAGAGSVSIWKYYTAYTMDSIAEATLGYQMHAQNDSGHPFLQAFEEGLTQCAKRMCSPWLHADLLYYNLPIYKKLLAMKHYIWDFIREIIHKKRKEIKKEAKTLDNTDAFSGALHEKVTTFLELLIQSSGFEDGYMDTEVIEELIVIMIAGNDTSAVGTSFVSLMLAQYPDVQEKVFKELQDVFGESNRPISPEDLPRLQYLEAVVKETLRLYPPVPVITRKIEKDLVLPSGVTLVPDTGALVHIWALHRNPRHWGADAEQFRPERFLHRDSSAPYFLPFSHGPRNCVGYHFAMTSMKIVLSSVLRRYQLLPAARDRAMRLTFDLMMKDADGCQIQVEHRSKQGHV